MKVGKIQSFPWYLRLVVFVVVAGLMYGGFWYFITKKTRGETQVIQSEVAQLKAKNAQAQIVSQRLSEFKALYKAREEEYVELKALLPEQRELTMVLQGIQDRARNNRLVLNRFNPKEDVLQDNYTGKKIEVSVVSSFANLRSFFEQLAHYQRIVSISNFDLRQASDQTPLKTVDAKFDLTAYYVSSERLQNQNQAKPKGAAGGAAPAKPAK